MAKIIPFAPSESMRESSDSHVSRLRNSTRRLTRSLMNTTHKRMVIHQTDLTIRKDNQSALRSCVYDLDVALAMSDYVNRTIVSQELVHDLANPHQMRSLALKLLRD